MAQRIDVHEPRLRIDGPDCLHAHDCRLRQLHLEFVATLLPIWCEPSNLTGGPGQKARFVDGRVPLSGTIQAHQVAGHGRRVPSEPDGECLGEGIEVFRITVMEEIPDNPLTVA